MNDLVNDLGNHDRNGAINSDRENSRRESEPGKPPKGPNRPRRRRGGRLFGLGGFVLLAAGLTLGGWGDYSLKREVATTAKRERDFVPSLHVATVEANAKTVTVSLPGTTAAFAAANVYARATGYIAKRNVDIGDRVKAGDLLAALAVPELDHQISQNEATLDQLKSALLQAQANRDLTQVTWNRDAPLVQKGWFTPQQGDTDRLNLQARTAAVAVAEANVSSQEDLLKVLRQNRDYAKVVAPFDGVITQRNVDVGSLVQGNAATGTFMFEVQQDDVIRVWVYVPQDSAFGVASGIDAVIRVPELPDHAFAGKVTRIADALQPGTRTLLTEIDIKNPNGALAPGIYCTVELHIPRKTPSLLVSADAIIVNRNGVQVAVADHGKVEIRKIQITRDLGTRVEVDSGVKAGDQVILNPPVTLGDGSKVQAMPEAPRT
jgi:RND family efflux transporter MFP subunit